jgi:hypothetical protein
LQISHKTQAAIQFLAPAAVIYSLLGLYLLRGTLPSLAALGDKSLALVFVGLAAMFVQDIVPKPVKEFLVFWRRTDRMPGHRAFSRKTLSHPQIQPKNIPNITDLVRLNPVEQQNAFYKMYDKLSKEDSIQHLSQRYIAWRDLTSLMALFAIVSSPVLSTFSLKGASAVGLILAGASGLAGAACSLAARNVANSLVIQVLSLTSLRETPNGEQ